MPKTALYPRRFRFDGKARRERPALRAYLAPQRERTATPMPVMTSAEKRARRAEKRRRAVVA